MTAAGEGGKEWLVLSREEERVMMELRRIADAVRSSNGELHMGAFLANLEAAGAVPSDRGPTGEGIIYALGASRFILSSTEAEPGRIELNFVP